MPQSDDENITDTAARIGEALITTETTELVRGATTRPVQEADIPRLREIMSLSVIDSQTGLPIPKEIEQITELINASIAGTSERVYEVAVTADGKILGMMGLDRPSDEMIDHCTKAPEQCGELVNAFVDPTERGNGAGRALVRSLESIARSKGISQIILNSGPRYRDTGWAFWEKMYGAPVDVRENHYGEGLDAPVWRADISQE